MIRYEDLAEKVARYHPGASLDMIQRGYVVSAKYHKGQVRMNGEPYLTHPLEVANILAELKLDPVAVTAGLLHDVIEDTLMSPEELRKQFGDEVYQVVDGVTKIPEINLASNYQKQAENFRKMLLAMVSDIRVLFIKLADRLHNMRTLQYLPPERRQRISQETIEIYAPLAHRLGMARIRGELEDLAFSFLDPDAYQDTVSQIEKRRMVSQDFILETKRAIEGEMRLRRIPVQIESRIKRIYGVYQKMKRQKITIDEVFDFVAVRVITDSVSNCYSVLGILHTLWKPVPGRIKDYIAMPRPNLYQSLHTSVIGANGQPFEIQIRTREMHRVAEEGIAAHWKYKEGRHGVEEGEEQLRWLRQLIESQNDISDAREFLSNLKVDLYPDEVFCFTPKGEVVTLPRDATPVDFAYTIHTEVGHRCVAAKVNNRIVPLRHRIRNGEIVEVITEPDAVPSREWLGFVKTARARGKIRHWINQKEKEDAVQLGLKLMEKEAHRFRSSWKKLVRMPEMKGVLELFGLERPEDILPSVGFGTIAPRQILTGLFPERAQPHDSREAMLPRVLDRMLGRTDAPIAVQGRDEALVYRAKCCHPIPGDEIVGYITRGKGISVHSAECRTVAGLMGTNRITEVKWVNGGERRVFSVRLRITLEDRQGILADITTAISNRNTNIRESRSTTDLGSQRGKVEFTVDVADVKHLQKVMQSLRAVAGVRGVERA
ncbi:MAG: bifunctional (p)ppGpp synthetase/guanosine-3',5'-bis(diphosphate) 3'-pyrophosphohydrolase [Acidobacteriota bacterium]|jgi:GTP pyrophosphokinase|nr:bifunctional (p)ppGpp synthetase/guanosine-3',5'-bis(diphosphate) 3'-pyrophosphohydrolase [Acidobacteriota bacterium]NLT34132.1 bifunctional (p)ppGpp synthetase/guanosine-3',5'-bis(diphosphate) 3'-pyrophosphohydrolase [Acidobacteriota bacterium]